MPVTDDRSIRPGDITVRALRDGNHTIGRVRDGAEHRDALAHDRDRDEALRKAWKLADVGKKVILYPDPDDDHYVVIDPATLRWAFKSGRCPNDHEVWSILSLNEAREMGTELSFYCKQCDTQWKPSDEARASLLRYLESTVQRA